MHGYGRSTDLLFQIYLNCSAAGPTDLLTIVQILNIMLIVRHLLTIMFTQNSCIGNLQVENV